MAAPFSTPGLHCRPIDDRGVENPKVGFDYDGAIHQTDRRRFVHDIGRAE
ncbi:MAG: hypothetical protein K0R33_3499, partial [Mycobacterium sp.]|nr:hypothetical protein [Mycobacterium sp.]